MPSSITDLRSFLGLLQFFRRFISKFARVAASLKGVTKEESGLHKWNECCDDAFERLKTEITEAPILVSQDWEKTFRGNVVSFQTAVGKTLTQLDENGRDRVSAFFSKRCFDANANDTAKDREWLGLVRLLGMIRFRCYHKVSTFEIFTEKEVLKHFIKPKLSRR